MTIAAALSASSQAHLILERQTCGNARCSCTRSLRRGQGLTHCANHQDSHPSLSVTVSDDRLLIHCQASCSQSDVIGALRKKQLWSDDTAPRQEPTRTIQATYDYRNADGALIFQTIRFYPKDFSQRRPDGHGGWVWNLKDVQPMLYRLPELLAADPRQMVWVVEGEKDVDRLRAGGLVATSSPMGAGKWRDTYAEALRGRRCIIVADNDEKGQDHARAIKTSLAGVADSARIVELPGLAEHGDVSDWLDAGHTLDDLRACASPAPKTWNAADLLERVLPQPRWAIPGLIAEGLSVLAGRPKFGKSWIALQLALAVSYGGRALSQIKVEQGDALYLALEDNQRRLQSRLRLLVQDGALPHHLELQSEWARMDEGGVEDLEAWLDDHPSTRLVVLDTWTLIRPRPHRGADPYFDDTTAARRVKALADRRHIAIVALHHTRKPFTGGSVTDFLDEVLGSSGLTAVADSVLVLQRERGKKDGVLHLTGRDVLEESRALQWDDATGWSLGGNYEESKLNRERQDVLKALRECDGPVSPTELATAMGRPYNPIKQMLFQMSRDGQVLWDGRGRYSAPIPADQGYLKQATSERAERATLPNLTNRLTGEANLSSKSPDSDAPPVSQASSALTGGASGPTEDGHGLAGLGKLAGLGGLGGLVEVEASPTCSACGRSLRPNEQHWPWLHDDCKIDPAPRSPP